MKRTFVFGFVVLVAACTQASSPASKWSANGTVDGFYRVDGKDVKLAFAHSQKGEPFADRPTIVVALTEKDPAESKGDPLFWHDKYGGTIVVKLQKNSGGTYDVIGSSFMHPAAKDGGGGGTGMVDVKDVNDANGQIAGELITRPDMTISDQKLDIDLKFKVPMPALK